MTQKNFWKLFPGIGKSFRKSLWLWSDFGKIFFFQGLLTYRKYSWNRPGNMFRNIHCLKTQNCKIWKKSWKNFRHLPCVTAGFLEIVSGIRQYGLKENVLIICWSTFFDCLKHFFDCIKMNKTPWIAFDFCHWFWNKFWISENHLNIKNTIFLMSFTCRNFCVLQFVQQYFQVRTLGDLFLTSFYIFYLTLLLIIFRQNIHFVHSLFSDILQT